MSIQKIEILYAGYCVNDEKRMFRGAKPKKIKFPAAAVLLFHKTKGYALFDTGYSREIYNKRGIIGWLYEKLNPDYIDEENEINTVLRKKGISEQEIKTVILSHIHPDHIGGLKFFGAAKYLLSETAYKEYEKPHIKSLVFKDLFPKDFSSKAVTLSNEEYYDNLFPVVYDIFGDKSALAVPLEGHAAGQIGLYIPKEKILFAADACWKSDYFEKTEKMRIFPKFLQNDFAKYKATQSLLKRVADEGIRIIYSHDTEIENGALV